MTPPPAVLLLLAPLLFQEKPAAPPPELAATFQFSTGADFAGGWQTTVVDLDSRTTRELDLTLRVEDDSSMAVATRHERLAPKARKRVFLYSPTSPFARGVPARYRITDDRGTELASGQLRASSRGYAANAFQIALFCRIPATPDDFGIPSLSNNNIEIRCARFSAEVLPDRWVGLAALDLIVLHDAPLDELTTDQARALQDYVRLGGTVLVIPGATPGTVSHPVVQSIAPIRAEPPRTVTSLPGFAAAFGSFRAPEPFLIQPLLNGTPALDGVPPEGGREFVRFDTGLGRVFVAGADLRRAPFDTWSGRHPFWSHVLTHTPRWYQEEAVAFPIAAGASQREELFARMSRLINPYPPFGLILGLAVVFLAVVGPLNYMLLWRLRRTLLLVLTVPGISVGFLALVVLLGYVLKGTSAVVHSARLLSTRSGLGVARETQLYSLFSPSARSYDVTFEPGTYGPFDRWSNIDRPRRRQDVQTTLTFQTGTAMSLRGLNVGQWQTWDLETRSLRELGKGVRFSVEGGRVKVHNDSPRTIERGLFLQTGPEPLEVAFPAVEPGKSVEALLTGVPVRGVEALGFGPDSLGETLLRPWLDAQVGSVRAPAASQAPQRFLLCVLRDEGTPVAVDARLSGRSRTISLLHVAEAP